MSFCLCDCFNISSFFLQFFLFFFTFSFLYNQVNCNAAQSVNFNTSCTLHDIYGWLCLPNNGNICCGYLINLEFPNYYYSFWQLISSRNNYGYPSWPSLFGTKQLKYNQRILGSGNFLVWNSRHFGGDRKLLLWETKIQTN